MKSDNSIHQPVMVSEVLSALDVRPDRRYVDCTLGTGGHALAILEASEPGGELLGIDSDLDALKLAKVRLRDRNAIPVNDNYRNLKSICQKYDFFPISGILFDLGLSSLQLDTDSRGFSFQHDAPLDMRFSSNLPHTASDIVNTYSETELADIIYKYGEERFSRRIAHSIILKRPLHTTTELSRIILEIYGNRRWQIHPATRTFQALRIAVNKELENIEVALPQAIELLAPCGRLVVISYHSLEDRLVKKLMHTESKLCICPPEVPVCVCNHSPTLKLVSKKVITPSLSEISSNTRSRSAKLRVAERC